MVFSYCPVRVEVIMARFPFLHYLLLMAFVGANANPGKLQSQTSGSQTGVKPWFVRVCLHVFES